MEYIVDESVDSDNSGDGVNVNCVLSWSQREGNIAIDFHNGWVFDSDHWARHTRLHDSVLAALKRNQSGKDKKP